MRPFQQPEQAVKVSSHLHQPRILSVFYCCLQRRHLGVGLLAVLAASACLAESFDAPDQVSEGHNICQRHSRNLEDASAPV